MNRETLEDIRKTCIWISLLAASFALMYFGVVLIIKYTYIYFRGFTPAADKLLLRVVFFGISAASVLFMRVFSKKRYSKERLKKSLSDPDDFVRSVIMTAGVAIFIGEVPLICGFFLFFLRAMYFDFYILAVVSVIAVLSNIPSVSFLQEKIKEADKD